MTAPETAAPGQEAPPSSNPYPVDDWPEIAERYERMAADSAAWYENWLPQARARVFAAPGARPEPPAVAAALPDAPEPEPPESRPEPARQRWQWGAKSLGRHAFGHRGDSPGQEEVMPVEALPRPDAPAGRVENVPRPGRELAPEDSTGPESHGTDPAVAVASTGPGHTDARRDEAQAALARDDQSGQSVSPRTGPPMRSGTIPPPVAEPEPAEPAADSDAEQFGAPDEPFWGDDAPRIVPPPETTEMTAIMPVTAPEAPASPGGQP